MKKNANEESLYESNDPFLLSRFETTDEVLDLLQRGDFSFEHNDNIYFLERIYALEKNRMGTTLITKDPRFKRLWEAVVSNLQYVRKNGGNTIVIVFILFYTIWLRKLYSIPAVGDLINKRTKIFDSD